MTEYRWEDLHLGLKHSFSATFTEEMMQHFAALSGDINPLHVDADYAIAAGFPGPVVFGMMTSSLYSKLVGVYLPGKYALLQGIDIDFNSPCHAGDVLNVEGEIIFLSDAVRRLEVKATIRRENRKLVSKATIRVGLHG
ncbi:MAG: MaoC domain protein dehydratase [Acidobacteriaceae bacterium]|nr:MaoC domain protein dehydratase [Acidobacteriaceae bacterium]